MNDNLDTA